MTSFTIREAIKEDIPFLVPLWMHGQSIINKEEPLSSREHYEQYFISLFNLIKSSPNHNLWVAVEDHAENEVEKRKPNILGWVAVTPYSANPLYFSQTGQGSIYVSPMHKNAGIGKKLAAVACSWAREHLRWVIGEVRVGNTHSEHIIGVQGFAPLGAVSPYMNMWHLPCKVAKL
jgi:hypothetical protein